MTLTFVLSLLAAALVGGIVGSLLGLGGGIIVVPVYTVVFRLPAQVAVGTSLVAVVANAAAASTVYLKSRVVNLRLALLLATITALGSLIGGIIGTSVGGPWLVGTFGVMLVGVGVLMLVQPETSARRSPAGGAAALDAVPGSAQEPAAAFGPAGAPGSAPALGSPPGPGSAPKPAPAEANLAAEYYDPAAKKTVAYQPRRVTPGLALSFVAGNLSGMLGIGGGVIQVPVMNLLFGMPIKASTATSSHIISLTAMAGAVVYLARGFIDPVTTAITVVGVYLGARLGARLNQVLPSNIVKRVFSLVLFYMAARMLAQAWGLPFLS